MNCARLLGVDLMPAPLYWHELLRPLSQVLLFGKADCDSVLKAPAAMYFVISELPSSITSGASPPASPASNFWRWLPHDWYWTSTSTPGCCALKVLLAVATASGQPLCASTMSQTTILSACPFDVPPLAVVAATASVAARTAATRNRAFMSPPGAWGATLASPIGLDHQPRPRDWHRPILVSRGRI